jgi:hypothetical protein
MTPAQVEEAARRRYNAVNSDFWSQDEVFKVIYEAEQILAQEALVIEDLDTSITTVAGTRGYAYPSLVIGIKRVEYDGQKLMRVDDREDDLLTLNNSNATEQGRPTYYSEWDDTLYLRPIPDAANTLTLRVYKQATLLTTASTTLSTPVRCHAALINYTVAQLAAKDKAWDVYDRFMEAWQADVEKHKAWTARKKRTDGFAVVKDEDEQAVTILGGV